MSEGYERKDGYVYGTIYATNRGIVWENETPMLCDKCGLPKEGEYLEMCNCEVIK